MEHTAESGLLANRIWAASCSFPSSTSLVTSGIGVDTGQCFLHWGTLHFRQRAAICWIKSSVPPFCRIFIVQSARGFKNDFRK